jgi:erythromycin esterase
MARNLIWLANDVYPEHKIIVWAATFHLVRNPTTIQVPGDDAFYSNVVTMGHRVGESLGEQVFTLGFTAYEGQAGVPWAPAREIGAAPIGSLEYFLARAGFDNAVVGFRQLQDDGAWLRSGIPARPLGYRLMRADWTQVLDGMVFTRKMYPSTRGR